MGAISDNPININNSDHGSEAAPSADALSLSWASRASMILCFILRYRRRLACSKEQQSCHGTFGTNNFWQSASPHFFSTSLLTLVINSLQPSGPHPSVQKSPSSRISKVTKLPFQCQYFLLDKLCPFPLPFELPFPPPPFPRKGLEMEQEWHPYLLVDRPLYVWTVWTKVITKPLLTKPMPPSPSPLLLL